MKKAFVSSTSGLSSRRSSSSEHMVLLIIVLDALFAFGALASAFLVRFVALSRIGPRDEMLTFHSYLGYMTLGSLAILVIFSNLRLYESEFVLSPRRASPRISRACLLWLIGFFAASSFLAFVPTISRLFCLLSALSLLVVMTLWRVLLAKYLRRFSSSDSLRKRVVFVGWNQDCSDAGKIMTEDPYSPLILSGAVRPPGGDFALPLPSHLTDHGRFEDLRAIMESGFIDVLITTDKELDRHHLAETIHWCEKEMVDFQLVPTCFRVLLGGLNLDRVYGMPLLGISRLPLHSKINLVAKRVVDAIGGAVGLVISAPLIAVFGALIYLESPGPIFYRQRRVGERGKVFSIIKLRSMRLDSEERTGPVWTVEKDPRCLRIGALMRGWNIDEVPQFWNVLKGDMSLVGPRPERPELIERFRDEIPHYNARHNIKPGITGWAQINGLRGNTDLSERVKYDLHYIERWNLLFDFQIMLLTFFKRRNAY